jgi:hypothetical protein
MPKHLTFIAVLAFLGSAACGGDREARETADDLTARPDGATASAGGLCGLFSRQEIAALLALPVDEGTAAGPGGTACQWDATRDDAAYVQVQVVPGQDYWSNPTRADGYESLDGIGSEAYVHPELGGWTAGALTDTAVAAVSLAGGAASRETAVRLLGQLVERM